MEAEPSGGRVDRPGRRGGMGDPQTGPGRSIHVWTAAGKGAETAGPRKGGFYCGLTSRREGRQPAGEKAPGTALQSRRAGEATEQGEAFYICEPMAGDRARWCRAYR